MIAASHNVLLIEGQPLLARVTEQMLKKSAVNRYSVVHRDTVEGALAVLEAGEVDVVLLDLNLPVTGDRPLLETILEAAVDVPVVVLTASQNFDAACRAIKLGAQDYLVKGDYTYLTLDRAIIYALERHGLRRTIQRLAVIDELTGLYNRRGYNALHGDLLLRARQGAAAGYFVLFDLDRFKQINDELGHARGDEALVEFAGTLRSIFPKDALLVRFGGDEFAAMGLERAPGAAAEAVHALRIVLSVRNSVGAPFQLEASAGLAVFGPEGPARGEEVAALADAALYRDKGERRHPSGWQRSGAEASR